MYIEIDRPFAIRSLTDETNESEKEMKGTAIFFLACFGIFALASSVQLDRDDSFEQGK